MAFLADPRLQHIAPEKLERWVDRPVRHTFPWLERALINAARWSGAGRPLDTIERNLLGELFGDSLALDPIRVVETRFLSAPTVLGNTIRVAPGYAFSGVRESVLVHEAMHLWQYQQLGTGYITDSVYHNVRSLMRTGHRRLAYLNYQLAPESRLRDFTSEQQATIVADYYELTHVFARAQQPPPWVAARRHLLPVYQQLMEEVRRGSRPGNG